MNDQTPFIYRNPRVGLALMIMMTGAMIGAPGIGVLSASTDDENTLRMKFEQGCMQQAAALGDIKESGETLTSTFKVADVRHCLDTVVAQKHGMRENALSMLKIGGLIILLGGTLLIPSSKDSDGPKSPRR